MSSRSALPVVPAGEARDSETARRFALCYQHLHALAAAYFRREGDAWTLQPTALVHEAYLRLAPGNALEWKNRGHFLSCAARAMRRVLVDLARRKGYQKRSPPGGFLNTLVDGDALAVPRPVDVLDLDRALIRLEGFDARKAAIVHLRFFGGMSVAEVAEALALSEATVYREWRGARAWLAKALRVPCRRSP